jgi:hypothetical protein
MRFLTPSKIQKIRRIENGEWKIENGEWRMENEKSGYLSRRRPPV